MTNDQEKRIKNLEAKEQVLYDIHNALGIKWGDDPYSAINSLKTAQSARVAEKDKVHLQQLSDHIRDNSSFTAEYECGYPCTPDGCLGHEDDVTDAVYILWELQAALPASAPQTEAKSERQKLEEELALKWCTALGKINRIRNSIVGYQNVNWSKHIYPLVAALEEAGYRGLGYEEARKSIDAEAAPQGLNAAAKWVLDAAQMLVDTAYSDGAKLNLYNALEKYKEAAASPTAAPNLLREGEEAFDIFQEWTERCSKDSFVSKNDADILREMIEKALRGRIKGKE